MVLNPCIDRYMRKQTIRISNLSKARAQKARGIELIISEYEDEMPVECIEHWRWCVNKLVSKIEKLEKNDTALVKG